jgi:hypothetical protein
MSIEKLEKRMVSLTDTPFGYTLFMIGRKWRLVILYWLVIRKEYPQIPPKVEYSLSNKGCSLLLIMESMCQWGTENSGKFFRFFEVFWSAALVEGTDQDGGCSVRTSGLLWVQMPRRGGYIRAGLDWTAVPDTPPRAKARPGQWDP